MLPCRQLLNAVGSGYSQSRRDDPGWYDCSSLVYRSYAAAGITYLNGMDAASEAECLVNKGMTVSYGELQPGDLIFLFLFGQRKIQEYIPCCHISWKW